MINAEFSGSPEEIEHLLDILFSMHILDTYTRPYVSVDKTHALTTATLVLPSSPEWEVPETKQD